MEIPDKLIKRAAKKAEEDFLKKHKEFNLSEKIHFVCVTRANHLDASDIKEFIKEIDKHTFMTDDGIKVIEIVKLKSLAGDKFA